MTTVWRLSPRVSMVWVTSSSRSAPSASSVAAVAGVSAAAVTVGTTWVSADPVRTAPARGMRDHGAIWAA